VSSFVDARETMNQYLGEAFFAAASALDPDAAATQERSNG
jgi:hypothetical protein